MESTAAHSSYTVVESTDAAAVETQIARRFRHIRLRSRLSPLQRIRFAHAPLPGCGVSLGLLDPGGPLTVGTDDPPKFFPVVVSLSGSARIRCGSESFETSSGGAIFPRTRDRLLMETDANWSQLALRFDQGLIEGRLAAVLGHALDHPLVFARNLKSSDGASDSLANVAKGLFRELGSARSLLSRGITAPESEQLLISTLLHAQQHNYSRELLAPAKKCPPRYVRRARNFLWEHSARPITIADLCQEIGVSERALYRGFRDNYDTTPMGYLRKIRLDAARNALQKAGARDNVTDIAIRCGFGHLGRFAADYRARFGEKPSEALRR